MAKAGSLAAQLRAWPKYGNGIGLHRMQEALEVLAEDSLRRQWLEHLDAVKITGSNGKGTTATLLAAIFAELGIGTGLYTSPHLRRVTERVHIDGIEVEEEELRGAWRRAVTMAETIEAASGDGFGAFELMTIAALDLLSGKDRVETIVAEAGIGGRFDATRVIPGSIVAMTSLDLEHTELLGSNLEAIAYDKADLCPDGGTLIVGAGLERRLLRRLRRYAEVRGIELVAVDEVARLEACRFGDRASMVFDMELRGELLRDVAMAMAGRHHWSNAVVALLLAEAWTQRYSTERHRPRLTAEALRGAWRRALAETRRPGRLQRVESDPGTEGPDIFIDFCHTPRAAEALADTVRAVFGQPGPLLVLGISADKDLEALATPLLEIAGAVVITRALHRGLDPERLDELVRRLQPGLERWCVGGLDEALALAKKEASRRGMDVLVAGGLFLGVEAAELLAGRDPAALEFF